MAVMEFKIETKNGIRFLVARVPMNEPYASTSGKTLVVCTTNGFAPTEVEVDGRRVSVSLTATIKPA